MNSDDNAWESAMSRDFDARVRNLHEAPLTLDDVKGKAGSIRRRRRTAVATGVLATAAVIVPAAVFVGLPTSDNSGPDPVENPTRVVDPAETTGYFDPETGIVHQPEGGTLELPLPDDVRVLDYAQLADGRVVVIGMWIDSDGAGNPPASAFVFDDGEPGEMAEYPMAGFGFRTADVDDGRDAAGWLAPDGTPTVLISDTEDVVTLGRISELDGVREATLAGLTCKELGPDVSCNAVARPGGLSGPSYVSRANGFTDVYSNDAVLAVSPDGTHHLAATKVTDEETCASLIQQDARQRISTLTGVHCFAGVLGPHYAFSPDGTRVVANHGEGYGPTSAEILDGHTLQPVATTPESSEGHYATYHQVAWGDSYVDMVVDYNQLGMEENAYELQRLNLDGTVETIRETGWIILETR